MLHHGLSRTRRNDRHQIGCRQIREFRSNTYRSVAGLSSWLPGTAASVRADQAHRIADYLGDQRDLSVLRTKVTDSGEDNALTLINSPAVIWRLTEAVRA
jgi:hypothetical protein